MINKTGILLMVIVAATMALAGRYRFAVNENFRVLASWEPLYFPKVKNHSSYSIINDNASIAVMSDADNTGLSATGYVEYIQAFGEGE